MSLSKVVVALAPFSVWQHHTSLSDFALRVRSISATGQLKPIWCHRPAWWFSFSLMWFYSDGPSKLLSTLELVGKQYNFYDSLFVTCSSWFWVNEIPRLWNAAGGYVTGTVQLLPMRQNFHKYLNRTHYLYLIFSQNVIWSSPKSPNPIFLNQ